MKIKKKQKKSKIIEIKYKNEKKINIIITCIILIIIYIPFYLMQEEKKYLKRKFILENEITIKIVGNGTKKILDGDFPAIPSEVNINGVKQDSAGKSINIEGDEDQETIVTMKFNSPLASTAKMFFYLKHIVEIDLSKFDFSSVKNMGGMFRECLSLSYIPDISGWNTAKVYSLSEMFYNCKSLTFLPDMSRWDTFNISFVQYIFFGCDSLSYLPGISNWGNNFVRFKFKSEMFDCCFNWMKLP
jgi:surface protein